MVGNLKLALAVYPDAGVEIEDDGLRLLPSSADGYTKALPAIETKGKCRHVSLNSCNSSFLGNPRRKSNRTRVRTY